jgi:hypothetical protein
MPKDLAVSAAAAMIGVPEEDVPPGELRDAVGELANMLGGNVKGSFACQAPDGICAPSSTIDDRALAMVAAAGAAAGGGADNAHRKHAKRYFTHVDR